MSFQLVRDRDAWATIRGYVYQVDVTIDRWLNLQPGQVLELERGEDIDVVSDAIQAIDHNTRQRLLEQIKHRASPLTLRSPEATAALVNFFEHRTANPGESLHFRFVTNADYGHEQNSPLPNRLPAIEAWERLRLEQGDKAMRCELLKGVRAFLATLSKEQKPHDIREDIWNRFRTFVREAKDEDFTTFIRSFEWGMGSADANSLRQLLQQRLLAERYARDADHAYTIYVQLFFTVFERLTHSGLKRLSVQDREQLLVKPSFDARAQVLLATIHDLLDTLEGRVRVVEERISTVEVVQELQTGQISTLQNQLEQMIYTQDIETTITYGERYVPSIDIPPLVDHLSHREETVGALQRQMRVHTWIALHGQFSCGKTQLAVLLVETIKTPCLWVRLNHNRSYEENRRRLDAACLELLNRPVQDSLYRWYKQVMESLGVGGILVLDGLPRLQGQDVLSESLLSLLKACKATNISMVSTSPYPLPDRIRSSCRRDELFTMACPVFTHREAADILRSYGAPAELLMKERAVSLNRLARKHPRLLQAMGYYLQREDWQLDTKTYEALFSNQHASDVIEETLSSILNVIEEEDNQQLLYRLNLIVGSFTLDDVLALANVAPAVQRPRERLHALLGLWIERNSRDQYVISPLVQMVGSHDVVSQARKECNFVLAERLLNHQPIYIGKISVILLYLVNAGQYDRAGLLFIQVLVDLQRRDLSVYDGDVLSYWSETPLPTHMNLGIRLYLRALQYAVRHKRGASTIYIERDLVELMKLATPDDAWALLGVLIVSSDILPNIHAVLLKILRYLPQAHLPGGTPMELLEELHLEGLIWLTATNILTVTDLNTWMETVSELTDKQRQYAFADQVAESGSLFVADVLWMQEAQRPEPQQQWNLIQNVVETLSLWAASLHLELLWACAMRARIIVAAEYHNDLPHAIAIAEETLRQTSNDPCIRFLIEESLGRQYLFAREYQEAALWLGRACEEGIEAYPTIKISTLLATSRAYGMSDPNAAVSYAERAVSLGKTTQVFPDLELVKAEGELALARWLTGDAAGTFEAWDSAGQRLLACRREDDVWKALFMLYGHVSGYFTAMVSTGEPPLETRDGSPYVVPERGIFNSEHQQRAALCDQTLDCYFMTQLALFALAVGQEQRMLAWCEQGLRLAREAQQPFAWATLCELEIPSLILSGNIRVVLDHALDIGAIGTAGMEQRTRVKDILKSELIIDEILGEKPNAAWNLVEERAAQIGMLPIVFWIATRTLTKRSEAITMAHDLAEHCRTVGETASDKALWVEGAAFMERIFEGQASWRDIAEQANGFSSEKRKTLRLLGYLGATIQRGMPLVETWFAHKSILESLGHERAIISSGTYQQIILPFFILYWLTAFEQQKFRFISPRLLERELQDVQTVPLRERARTLFAVIARGLDITTAI